MAAIDQGLLVLLGVAPEDTADDVAWMVRKLPQIRIFEDEGGAMNRSLLDTGGAIIVVSQFTLYADARKGARPSFSGAARPEQAVPLYEALLTQLRATLGTERVGAGRFGAVMQVSLLNDGPVTIILESRA